MPSEIRIEARIATAIEAVNTPPGAPKKLATPSNPTIVASGIRTSTLRMFA
jgi:hypothetical protein